MSQRHRVLGAADLLISLLLLGAVWGALPARWAPVDYGVSALAVVLGVAGVALFFGMPRARSLGLFAAGVALVVGMALSTALFVTGAQLLGLYGPVGRGAAIILSIVGFLVVPYLVLLPAAQLYTLLPNRD